LASSTHAHAIAEPVARRKRRARRKQARARGGILWIAVSGILLAGVVFVSVAVLRLNLALDGANGKRAQLTSDVAALQAQLASTLAAQQIQAKAQQELGVQPATSIGYVDLSR
jgi:preprotein translocase subunit SecF